MEQPAKRRAQDPRKKKIIRSRKLRKGRRLRRS